MLSNNPFGLCAALQYVLLFIVLSKFRPVSNFTELHVLTLSSLFLCTLAQLIDIIVDDLC